MAVKDVYKRQGHNIDAKGRLIIPAKFREDLGEQVVITRGLDGCLCVYTMEQWKIMYEQLDVYKRQLH